MSSAHSVNDLPDRLAAASSSSQLDSLMRKERRGVGPPWEGRPTGRFSSLVIKANILCLDTNY